MSEFSLQCESPGQAAERKRKRRFRNAYLAQTWSRWFCWGMFMPDEPEWSGLGMIWRYRGQRGKILFGIN